MTQHDAAHVATDADAPSRRGRRALIAGAATAAVGALGVAIAKPADAAAGSALLLGRSNTSGSAQTVVASTNTTAAVNVRGSGGSGVLGDTDSRDRWGVHSRNTATSLIGGAGGAVRGEGRNNTGVRGDTTNPDRHGLSAVNNAAASGLGTAVRANGRNNVGVWATADDINVPAVFADGANSAGVAMAAFGFVDVEGPLFALNAQVGVISGPLNGGTIVEAFVASGTSAFHLHGDSVTTAGVTMDVTPPVDFTDAADLSLATIMLTGRGEAIGGAYVGSKSATSFTIEGATPGQGIDYLVLAPRLDVFFVGPAKAGKPARRLTHATTFHDPRG
jgi:hypothetical protein